MAQEWKDTIYLRPVLDEDKDMLFGWINDSDCRKNSLNTEPISYESHCLWFEKKLRDENCDLFICMWKEEAVGQIRLDYQDDMGVISYSVAKDYRGRGLGGTILRLAEQKIRGKAAGLTGIVKRDNLASQKAFEKNGYSREVVKEGYRYTKKANETPIVLERCKKERRKNE